MKLRIYYQNVNGLKTKTCDIRHLILTRDLDIIVLCETWLNENFFNEEIFGADYIVYRQDRDFTATGKSDGGGCCIAVKAKFISSRKTEWEASTENIWVSIKQRSGANLYINVRYIALRSSFDQYDACFKEINDVINLHEPSGQFLLLGDYNLGDSIDWSIDSDRICYPNSINGNIAEACVELLELTNLSQFNHVKNVNDRCLDLALSNIDPARLTLCEDVDPITKVDRHHPPLLIDIDVAPIPMVIENRPPKINFFRADYDVLNAFIERIDWVNELDHLNVDDATQRYYEILSKLFEVIPKVKTAKFQYPRWFSKELICLLRSKLVAHSKLRAFERSCRALRVNAQNQSEYIELYQNFSFLRRQAKDLTEECHDKYVSDIERKLNVNSKCFFSYTKSLKTSNTYPNNVQYGDESATDKQSTCNLFARYFATVYQEPDSNVIEMRSAPNNLRAPTLKPEDITPILLKLDQNKASSPDQIPAIFYKKTSSAISVPLSLIFNKSLDEKKYPARWKVSFVTPIFKNGSRTKVINYRPISILCTASQIFERVIFGHLYKSVRNQFSRVQHGFIKGRSTLSNLLEYVHNVVEGIANGGQIDTIFTDFSKAFDKVSHNILLQKLRNYGVDRSFLPWFETYLVDRSQFVVIGNTKSSRVSPTSGIPQGSILGPLLFLIFIENLPSVFKSAQPSLFADDLKLYRNIRDVGDCNLLQEDLNSLSQWCITHKLYLNVSKCYSLTTTNKKNKIDFAYDIEGTDLNKLTEKSDLGVVFDDKLSFKQHIDAIIRSAYKMLGFIFRSAKRFKTPKSLIVLYNAYVRSRLEYCCSVWNPIYHMYSDSIERVQRKFTRMLYYKFYWVKPDYHTRLKQLKMQSLETRRLQFDEFLLHKLVHGNIDSILGNELNFNNPTRTTRNQLPFYLPFNKKTNIERNSPIYRLQAHHNEYYSSINIMEPNFIKFKNKVKNHFDF